MYGFKWFWVILATKCTCVVNIGFCKVENSCALTVHNHLVNSRQTASVSLRADPKTAVICGWEKSKLKKGIPSVGSGYNVVSDGHDRGTEPYPVLVLVSLSWILFIEASLDSHGLGLSLLGLNFNIGSGFDTAMDWIALFLGVVLKSGRIFYFDS